MGLSRARYQLNISIVSVLLSSSSVFERVLYNSLTASKIVPVCWSELDELRSSI